MNAEKINDRIQKLSRCACALQYAIDEIEDTELIVAQVRRLKAMRDKLNSQIEQLESKIK